MTEPRLSSQNGDLSRLAEILLAMPPGRRGALFQQVVAFRTEGSLGESFAVGPLRAAFAEYWETRFGEAIPVDGLRLLLAPPVPIKTVLEFSRLSIARRFDEMTRDVEAIATHLAQRIETERGPAQRTLFPLTDETNSSPSRTTGHTVTSLADLVAQERKFATIYADPPWPYENEASRAAAVNHYPSLSLEAICREPVEKLSEENAHLHLWTTNGFLREAFEVMNAWGYQFKSCLVWVKDELGMGNYWRVSHEFLLLGVRGSLTFRDRSVPSWIQAHRSLHSRKPRAVRALVERVSPSPYLELYGREELPDSEWTVYGNAIERRLF